MEDKQDCSLGTMELERTENKLCSGCEDGITPATMEVSSPEGDNPQHNEAKKSEGDLEPKPVKAQEKEKGEDKKKWVEQLEAASKHEKVEPRLR
ncbi:hypothetical protein SLS60_009566 [Paraconiothyrium brasiliense]|uniref:Uncharacterized protein n=1 Tax=Paraconiothyrium brasiliense TaxID=300254 RepID=A0ABR3QUR1_9PLEO